MPKTNTRWTDAEVQKMVRLYHERRAELGERASDSQIFEDISGEVGRLAGSIRNAYYKWVKENEQKHVNAESILANVQDLVRAYQNVVIESAKLKERIEGYKEMEQEYNKILELFNTMRKRTFDVEPRTYSVNERGEVERIG